MKTAAALLLLVTLSNPLFQQTPSPQSDTQSLRKEEMPN
jgi:hypothetical protein